MCFAQGYPVNIHDFKVLLDKRVYRGIEGGWRDLFGRIKWDTVKSALKSVAGLQGRKFKVGCHAAVRPSSACALARNDRTGVPWPSQAPSGVFALAHGTDLTPDLGCRSWNRL